MRNVPKVSHARRQDVVRGGSFPSQPNAFVSGAINCIAVKEICHDRPAETASLTMQGRRCIGSSHI